MDRVYAFRVPKCAQNPLARACTLYGLNLSELLRLYTLQGLIEDDLLAAEDVLEHLGSMPDG